ncbi:hypothetical protein WQQ_41970 [Hydrocarboniphaga effusa AP103]|uniref:Uncharacterized protein n=1 Tax=Hydrocarboniphaga effusa AP103 TaxID=1172194 RepID=I7Z7Z8_9GAMM|nr:hypothetical protein WQQ_41970 [Hydrocarboniphaga effusa AP103]
METSWIWAGAGTTMPVAPWLRARYVRTHSIASNVIAQSRSM